MVQTLKKDSLILVETAVATLLFGLTLYNSDTELHINFSIMISLGLYYMIFIELTRALFDFVFGEEHKFKVRYIYDLGIIFLVREILVVITANHHHIEEEFSYLIVSGSILVVLFILRIVDAKVFNYNNKCDTCIHHYKKEH